MTINAVSRSVVIAPGGDGGLYSTAPRGIDFSPPVTAVSPPTWAQGATITLTAAAGGFGASQAGQTITINDVEQAIVSWDDTTVTFTASASSASFGSIRVDLVGAGWAFSDGFETYNNSEILTSVDTPPTSGITWGIIDPGRDPVNCVVTTARSYAGTKSLQFSYPATVDSSPTEPGGWAEQRFRLDTPSKEVWIQFQLFVPSNYAHRTNWANSKNNKLLYLDFGVTYPGGTRTVVGYTGFEMWRLSDGRNYLAANFRKNSANKGHSHDTDPLWSPNGPANTYNTNGGTYKFLDPALDNDAWHLIKIHLKISSSPAASDGEVEVWKDGVKVVEHLNFDNSGNDPSAELYQEGYLMGYHNSGYANATTFCIDDLKIQEAAL